MTFKGEVIRKGLEAFTSAKAYYHELGKAHDYYQYLRNNVKGVSFDRQPGGGNSETKALAFDREMQEITCEMYRLQLFLDWIRSSTSWTPMRRCSSGRSMSRDGRGRRWPSGTR